MIGGWHEEAITRAHDRAGFDCGDAALSDFLLRYARQSHDQGAAKTFLAIGDAGKAILGFYSLAPAPIACDRTPILARRGQGRHEAAGFRLARIAVHRAAQGKSLGGQLLLAAGRRCMAAAAVVGGTILVIGCQERPRRRLVRQLWRGGAAGCRNHPGAAIGDN